MENKRQSIFDGEPHLSDAGPDFPLVPEQDGLEQDGPLPGAGEPSGFCCRACLAPLVVGSTCCPGCGRAFLCPTPPLAAYRASKHPLKFKGGSYRVMQGRISEREAGFRRQGEESAARRQRQSEQRQSEQGRAEQVKPSPPRQAAPPASPVIGQAAGRPHVGPNRHDWLKTLTGPIPVRLRIHWRKRVVIDAVAYVIFFALGAWLVRCFFLWLLAQG